MDFLDLDSIDANKQTSVDDILAGKLGKRKPKKSILDDIQDLTVLPPVVPPPIIEDINTEIVAQVSAKTEQKKAEISVKNRKTDPAFTIDNIQLLPPEVLEEKNIERSAELQLVTVDPLPDNVNIIKVEAQLNDAITNIPDADDIDISNIKLITSTQKDKTGYYKTKCVLGVGKYPDIIRDISSKVKTLSGGLIPWRETDTRVIGNTNKTQLRTSALKLHVATVTYKPDPSKLAVNKGTRVMVSVPANYDATGNLLIYIQESRDKSIHEVSPKDFPSYEQYVTFIVRLIVEYYQSGYDMTLKKLKFRSSETNAPLIAALSFVAKSGNFKVRTKTVDDRIVAAEFISKDPDNHPFIKFVLTSVGNDKYSMSATNTALRVDAMIDNNISSEKITGTKLQEVLFKLFARDWNAIFKTESDDRLHYLMDKLTHKRLKVALMTLDGIATSDENECELSVAETLTKTQAAKRLEESYDAESIIGKTNACDFFLLSYLAVKIDAGDSRSPSEYITSPEYHEKYDVRDKRSYNERSKILAMQGATRNYNARKYKFMLEVKSGSTTNKFIGDTFEDVMAQSNLLVC